MSEDAIQALTQERSDVKREIKRWVHGFKKTNGRPPNEQDKEAVLGLYQRYSELEQLLNQTTAEVAAEAPNSPDVSRRKIEELQSKIEELQSKIEELEQRAQNSVAHQADAITLLSLTTQVCKQRAVGEERLARSELSCMQLKQRVAQAENSLAKAQAEAREQTKKLEEALLQVSLLEQGQKSAVQPSQSGGAEGEWQAQLDSAKLECEELQAKGLRQAREWHQER